jgi:hypothetical protein
MLADVPATTDERNCPVEIKVTNDSDGCAHVEVINPTTEECVSKTDVIAGQSLPIVLPDVHDASGIQIGEVVPVEAAAGEPEPGQGEPPAAGEPEPGAGEPPAGGATE